MADFQIITSDFVTVHISTSTNDILFSEKRFAKDITVSDLKVNPCRNRHFHKKIYYKQSIVGKIGVNDWCKLSDNANRGI